MLNSQSPMRLAKQLVLASNNVDKFKEFESLLKPYPGIELVRPTGLIRNADKIAAVETHSTYLENAIAKARLANQGCHYPSLADDTGLEVLALEGRPGVRSHRYAKLAPQVGGSSREAQDQANRDLLLKEMSSAANRSARFVTVLALIVEGILIHAEGVLEGTIATAPRGMGGFGYDPLFIPKDSQKTLGEMTEMEKNAISHRARAIEALMLQVQTRGIVIAKP